MKPGETLLIDLHASLLKKATQLAQEISVLTQKPTGAIYFDSYADDETLPPGDQVGLSGLTFDTDSHFVNGSFMMGMTTQTDSNLFRLMEGMNRIFSEFIPGGRMEIVDGPTGVPRGFMNFTDDTTLLKVGGKAGRPVQMITVNFVTTIDYAPED